MFEKHIHIHLHQLLHFSSCPGGGGLWSLSGGERDQQPGSLPQHRAGAAPPATSQRQCGGSRRS